MGTLWAKSTIAVACLTIVAFLFTNVVLSGAVLGQNPLLTAFGYFLLVDWSLEPWQILMLSFALLSVVIVFWLDNIFGDLEYATETENLEMQKRCQMMLGWIERLMRLRLVLVLLFWVMIGGHALLYFNSLKCWFILPTNVQRWAEWAYRDHIPKSLCNSLAYGYAYSDLDKVPIA
jgi:hypothetical protein